jgi:murein tripeptide amidase MpaA
LNPRLSTLFIAALLALWPISSQAQTTPDWRTPAEVSGYGTTPNYADTVAYLERIAKSNPAQVRIENFGKTGEGRDLKIVIASKDGVFDSAAIHASGRAILLVQNSIHAGEMDGKDACLALLRDLVQDENGAKRLLDHVVFVFIPVYNIDGHEQRSPYNRINQNGPELSGWRGNATNLNLNRDYMKADAPETRAFL